MMLNINIVYKHILKSIVESVLLVRHNHGLVYGYI